MDLSTLPCLWRVGMWSGPGAEGAKGKAFGGGDSDTG